MSSFLKDALASLFRVRLRPGFGSSLAFVEDRCLLGASRAHGLIGPMLAHLICRLAERRLERMTRRELARLDDRMLRDIGIDRLELKYLRGDGLWLRRSAPEDELAKRCTDFEPPAR